jgi:hypothetical protein
MLALAPAVAALQAAQAALPPEHDGLLSRLLLTGLCYAQPLVRSWQRYRTRLFAHGLPPTRPPAPERGGARALLAGTRTLSYWTEDGIDRTELVGLFIAYLLEHRWGTTIDSGWADWDVQVHGHPWTRLRVCTAQEDHGGRKRLIRVRYRLGPTRFACVAAAVGLVTTVAAAGFHPAVGTAGGVLLALLLLGAWWRGAHLAGRIIAGLDGLAGNTGLVRCGPGE